MAILRYSISFHHNLDIDCAGYKSFKLVPSTVHQDFETSNLHRASDHQHVSMTKYTGGI